jgi:glycine/D-amino acid oxidase-like deaminating enzyme
MSQDLNFNVMFSQRGVLTIAHSEHELREMSRRVHAIRLNGIDSEILGPAEIKKIRSNNQYRSVNPLSGYGRLFAAARRHSTPRRGGLGLCARGR